MRSKALIVVILTVCVLAARGDRVQAQAWIMSTIQEGNAGTIGLMSGVRLSHYRDNRTALLVSVREVITRQPEEVRLLYAVPKSLGAFGPISDIEVTATIRRAQAFNEAWPLPLSDDGLQARWHIEGGAHHEASQFDECEIAPCDFVPYDMALKDLFPVFLGEAGGFVPGVYELRVELRLESYGTLLPLYETGDAIAGFRDAWSLSVEFELGELTNE